MLFSVHFVEAMMQVMMEYEWIILMMMPVMLMMITVMIRSVYQEEYHLMLLGVHQHHQVRLTTIIHQP
jgi:uncharacterized membrane protein YcjF (UPF0283 family)